MKLLYLLTLFISFCVQAQNQLISSGNIFEGEPYLAINPQNSNHLVAAWMGHQFNQKIVIKSLVSFDGGTSWTRPFWQTHQQLGNTSADVSLAFNANGTLFMAYIDYDNINFSNGAIVCRKSTDGGLNWNEGVVVRSISSCPNKLCIDRPWIAVDPLSGNIFITSTNANQPGIVAAPFHPYLAISSDQGANFILQELDQSPYLAGNTISQPMPSPAFANDGTFMAIYPSYYPAQHILPRLIEVTQTNTSVNFNYEIAYQGLGFGTTNDTLKSGPHLSLDPSNANRANYSFISDVFGDPDIFTIEKSGTGWSTPTRVNADLTNNGVIQDLVWSDYDSDGDLAVCWRDRRNGISSTYQSPTQIYCRIQSNQDWGDEFIISPLVDHDSILLESGNDFLNIQFDNNHLYVIWGDVRQGGLKIYLNHLNQLTNSTSTCSIPTLAHLYPNPSNGSFNIPDDLIGKAFVLYTSDGQQAKTGLLDSQIDLSMLKSGTYLLQVTAYSFTLVKN